MQDLPIGIFDSGVGGLTVLRALLEALPGEDFVYLGDTARLVASGYRFRFPDVDAALQAVLAEQQFKAAEQELLVRVAKGYFDVLQAQAAATPGE